MGGSNTVCFSLLVLCSGSPTHARRPSPCAVRHQRWSTCSARADQNCNKLGAVGQVGGRGRGRAPLVCVVRQPSLTCPLPLREKKAQKKQRTFPVNNLPKPSGSSLRFLWLFVQRLMATIKTCTDTLFSLGTQVPVHFLCTVSRAGASSIPRHLLLADWKNNKSHGILCLQISPRSALPSYVF